MKKLMTFIAFFILTTIASAQQSGQPIRDTLQRQVSQPVARPAANQRTAPTDVEAKSKAEFQATKRAKYKGRTQKVTTAERSVSDSVKKAKEIKPQLQHDKPSH